MRHRPTPAPSSTARRQGKGRERRWRGRHGQQYTAATQVAKMPVAAGVASSTGGSVPVPAPISITSSTAAATTPSRRWWPASRRYAHRVMWGPAPIASTCPQGSTPHHAGACRVPQSPSSAPPTAAPAAARDAPAAQHCECTAPPSAAAAAPAASPPGAHSCRRWQSSFRRHRPAGLCDPGRA